MALDGIAHDDVKTLMGFAHFRGRTAGWYELGTLVDLKKLRLWRSFLFNIRGCRSLGQRLRQQILSTGGGVGLEVSSAWRFSPLHHHPHPAWTQNSFEALHEKRKGYFKLPIRIPRDPGPIETACRRLELAKKKVDEPTIEYATCCAIAKCMGEAENNCMLTCGKINCIYMYMYIYIYTYARERHHVFVVYLLLFCLSIFLLPYLGTHIVHDGQLGLLFSSPASTMLAGLFLKHRLRSVALLGGSWNFLTNYN